LSTKLLISISWLSGSSSKSVGSRVLKLSLFWDLSVFEVHCPSPVSSSSTVSESFTKLMGWVSCSDVGESSSWFCVSGQITLTVSGRTGVTFDFVSYRWRVPLKLVYNP
jgi:hypothetical protein